MELKFFTLIIVSFFLIIHANDTSAQSIELSAKVVIKKDEQYLKVKLKSREKINMQLWFLENAFLTESLEPKVYFYDSLNIDYQDKYEDSLSPADYYNIVDPPILFFIHDGKYVRYFCHDLKTFFEEKKGKMWVFEGDPMFAMVETYKRRTYKIPLSIDPEVLKLKPKKIFFYALVSYSYNYKETIEVINVKVKGKVRYCIGWNSRDD